MTTPAEAKPVMHFVVKTGEALCHASWLTRREDTTDRTRVTCPTCLLYMNAADTARELAEAKLTATKAIEQANQRDKKWMDGINEIVGQKLQYDFPDSNAAVGLDGFVRELRQKIADTAKQLAAETTARIAAETARGVAEAACEAAAREREGLRERKDAAYLERNRVVAAMGKLAMSLGYPVGVGRTAIEGWSEDWHGCVYMDLPTGQVSWHYHDSQGFLFEGFPNYAGTWDGHSTELKYERLAALANVKGEKRA